MDFLNILAQYGGLGVLAAFSGYLLRAWLEQQKLFAAMFSNHLTKLLERQEINNKLLAQMLDAMQKHEERAGERQERLMSLLQVRREP